MDVNRLSVARLLELDVPLTWQEAVAVTQEACVVNVVNATLSGRPSKIEPDTCFLTRRGDVELPVPAPTDAPDAAQRLLRVLLAGRETPEDLEMLAFGRPSPHLGDDLAPFSRPNRRAEIASLAERGLRAAAEFSAGTLAAPRPTTRPPARPMAARPPVTPSRPRPESRPAMPPPPLRSETLRARLPVSARAEPPPFPARLKRKNAGVALRMTTAVIVIAMAGAAAVWPRSGPAAAAPRQAAEAAPEPTTEPAPTAIVLGDGVPNAATTPVPHPGHPGRLAIGSRARRPTAAETMAVRAPVKPTSTPAVAAPAVVPEAGSAGDASATGGATTEGSDQGGAVAEAFGAVSVYSWTSPDVEPPRLTYPGMPRSAFPPLTEEAISGPYFEVLVDQTGAVEAVRMHGQAAPGETIYQYRMLLAAAKAWRFTPAMRDGQPVRYVVRVVLP